MKAIIFDWNGVITDSLKLDHELFLKQCDAQGLKVPRSLKFFTDLYDSNIFQRLIAIGYRFGDIETEEFKLHYKNGIKRTPAFAEIRPLLKKLHKKHKMFIVTSSYKELVDAFFKIHSLEKYFDAVLAHEHHYKKEEKIKFLLSKFSLKKNEVIYIGDTVGDIKFCKAIGIKVIAASWGYHTKNKLKKNDPDFIAEKPSDILRIVDKI